MKVRKRGRSEATTSDGAKRSDTSECGSVEQHLVFQVLFLQVLHKCDHFVDDWIQHWLQAEETLLVKAAKVENSCSSKLYSQCTAEKLTATLYYAVICMNVAVTAHLDDVGVQVFCTNTKRLD